MCLCSMLDVLVSSWVSICTKSLEMREMGRQEDLLISSLSAVPFCIYSGTLHHQAALYLELASLANSFFKGHNGHHQYSAS